MADENGTPTPSADDAVFAYCDVPVRTMFEHLAAGGTVESYLTQFPQVRRSCALGVLELARQYWGKQGPKGHVEDPGPEIHLIYESMCKEFSAADFERHAYKDLSEAISNPISGASIESVLAEIANQAVPAELKE